MNLSDRSAYGALAALCLFFLAISLVTASRFPPVWIDEVQFTDPAANLVLHGHFSSTVWIVQRGDEFWAGNTPLYTLMLADLPYTLLKGGVFIHPTLCEGFFALLDSVKPVD